MHQFPSKNTTHRQSRSRFVFKIRAGLATGCLQFALLGSSIAETKPALIPDMSAFMLERNWEVALARSAAPDQVSAKASIWVLGKHGYQEEIKGTNEIICYVVRSWGCPVYVEEVDRLYMPDYQVPECLDTNAVTIYLAIADSANRISHRKNASGRYESNCPRGFPPPVNLHEPRRFRSATCYRRR